MSATQSVRCDEGAIDPPADALDHKGRSGEPSESRNHLALLELWRNVTPSGLSLERFAVGDTVGEGEIFDLTARSGVESIIASASL